MDIKTRISRSKTGDTFVLLIKSDDREFDGRYLIFIRVIIDYRVEEKSDKVFRVKITKEKKIPTTLEEIEALEFVQIRCVHFENRYGAVCPCPKDVEWVEKNHIQFYPDEFEYLKDFQTNIIPSKGKYPEELTYIGNFDITPPEEEYIAPDPVYIDLNLWEDIVPVIIQRYQLYNKRDKMIYNHESAFKEKMRCLMERQLLEKVTEYFQNMSEEKRREWEESLPYIEESETYVGGDEEPEEWKMKD